MNAWSTRQLIQTLVRRPANLLQEDVVLIDHAQAQVFRGLATAQSLLLEFLCIGFPDTQLEIHTVVHDSRYTVIEFIFNGCHAGPFMGIAPTGQPVAVPMALICQRREGKIGRAGLYYDAGTLLRQLGLAL